MLPPSPLALALAGRQGEGDPARLARRLQSWLDSEPAPADILDTLYQVSRRLDAMLPGGLEEASAAVVLDIFCQCLIYCDLDDFVGAWPHRAAPPTG
jgi:hypothetical protein